MMCVDLSASIEHCGQCGRICGNGQICNRGVCQLLPTDCTAPGASCGPGYFCDPQSRQCLTGCRLSTDCPAGGLCSTGTCRCPTGEHACGQQCVPNTSVNSCGTSCRVCPSANGTATCNGSTCGLTCAAGQFPRNGMCVPWTTCQPGTFQVAAGTATTDRSCSPCGAGTYSTAMNSTACTAFTTCSPGSFVQTAGTATADRACAACANETYSTATNATGCVAQTVCQPGSFVSAPASATTARTCASCSSGTFSSSSNAAACTALTVCQPGTFVNQQGTATADRTCLPCGNETFSDITNALACAPWTTCTAGSFVTRAATAAIDRTCAACAAGSFSKVSNATACTVWRQCTGGVEFWPGTITSNRACLVTRPFATSSTSAQTVAVDSAGNALVACNTSTTFGDGCVRKYDTAGNLTWTQTISTPDIDSASAVAVGPAGSVVVVGTTRGTLPGQMNAGFTDAWVRKFDALGNELWTRQFGVYGNDSANAVAVDAAGNIVVTGVVDGAFPGFTAGGGDDLYVRKYDSAGNVVWTRQYSSTFVADEAGNAIAFDPAGNVYVAGATQNNLGGPPLGGIDAFIMKLDSAGTRLWTRNAGGPYDDVFYGLAIDQSGNAYTAGVIDRSGNFADALLEKHLGTNATDWSRQFDNVPISGTAVAAFSVAVDALGNALVVGTGNSYFFLRKYSPAGVQLTQASYSESSVATGVTVDSLGRIVICGRLIDISFTPRGFVGWITYE